MSVVLIVMTSRWIAGNGPMVLVMFFRPMVRMASVWLTSR